MINKAHLTAIGRKKMSAPMTWLLNSGSLNLTFRSLDYGCGRGFDANFLKWSKYDPHYFPHTMLAPNYWQQITCHFVLNVMPEAEGLAVLKKIQSLLSWDGIAFITVRRDVKVEGLTSKGTYQWNPVLNLPVVHKTSSYCIYRLDKHTAL